MQAGRRKEVSALPNAWSKDVGWSSRRKSLQAGSDFRRELHLALASQEGKKMPKVVWIWSGFEPFLGSFWDLEAFFRRKEKRCQKWFGFGLDLNPFWLHFETWRHFFRSRFSMFFLEVPFSVRGRLLGTNGGQKASKMEPKGSLGVFSGE